MKKWMWICTVMLGMNSAFAQETPPKAVLDVMAMDYWKIPVEADVWIDGKKVGKTPYIEKREPGDVDLEVVVGDAVYRETVSLFRGETSEVDAILRLGGLDQRYKEECSRGEERSCRALRRYSSPWWIGLDWGGSNAVSAHSGSFRSWGPMIEKQVNENLGIQLSLGFLQKKCEHCDDEKTLLDAGTTKDTSFKGYGTTIAFPLYVKMEGRQLRLAPYLAPKIEYIRGRAKNYNCSNQKRLQLTDWSELDFTYTTTVVCTETANYAIEEWGGGVNVGARLEIMRATRSWPFWFGIRGEMGATYFSPEYRPISGLVSLELGF